LLGEQKQIKTGRSAYNSTYKKLAVQWWLPVLCFEIANFLQLQTVIANAKKDNTL
jgi:lysozyme family protein